MKQISAFLFLVIALNAQPLLTDDFSSASLNTAKWRTVTGSSSASVVQSNGAVTLTGGGILATAAQFATPYSISGTVTLLDSYEHFEVCFRATSNGSQGMFVSFSNDGDQISIQQTTPTSTTILKVDSFPLSNNAPYSFEIRDTGEIVTLLINGVEKLSTQSTYSAGGYIAFRARNFSQTASRLSAVTISALAPASVTYTGSYFTDMFTGSTLNASYWRTFIPYSDSTVVQSGGAVAITNSGKFYSANALSGTIDITFKFAFTGGSYDSFRIYTRTFGISGKFFDRGIAYSFRIKSDTGQTTGNVGIEDWSAGPLVTNIASGTFPMTTNETYTVRIVDNGTNQFLYLNNTTLPFLTANSSKVYGNLVGFDNREGAGNGSYISAGSQVKISAFTVQSASVVTVEKPVTVNVPYPVPDTSSHLVNMSTLGNGTFTTGFVIAGDTPKKMLIRGIGPTLRVFGVSGAATDTRLTLNSGSSVVASNAGWSAAANASQIAAFAGAFALQANSADSAILVTLNPGSYTATVSSNGVVLLEAYEVP